MAAARASSRLPPTSKIVSCDLKGEAEATISYCELAAGWCFTHQSRARSSVHMLIPSTSASRSESSLADCGRAAGSFARQDRMRRSSASGIGISVRVEGGLGAVWTWCRRSPMEFSAVKTNCPVSSQ